MIWVRKGIFESWDCARILTKGWVYTIKIKIIIKWVVNGPAEFTEKR